MVISKRRNSNRNSMSFHMNSGSALYPCLIKERTKFLYRIYVFSTLLFSLRTLVKVLSSFAAGILKQTLPSLKRAAVETADETSQQLNQALDYNDFLLVVILKFGTANTTVVQ